jgi:site-specific DNA-methyltransferase (adenine-specific)
MKNIPDKSIDMILADLPYQQTQNKLDILIPFEPLWKQYLRVIKNNGCIALFGQGLFYVDLVNSQRKLYRYDLVWDKVLSSGFLNANKMPLRRHEQIAIFYEKFPTYNPQMTEGNPLHGKGSAYKTKELTNNNYGKFIPNDDTRKGSTQKYPTSILQYKKVHPSKSLHRTEKSIELLENLIKTYTNECDTVLDNVMGSGTCGVACKNLGRRFIGIEKEQKYFDIAKERIETIK